MYFVENLDGNDVKLIKKKSIFKQFSQTNFQIVYRNIGMFIYTGIHKILRIPIVCFFFFYQK